MKSTFLDKLIGRIERVDPQSLQSVVLKLAREKGFLETLFNTLQEGVMVIDTDGRISYLNAAAGQLLGVDLERGVGEPISRHLRDVDWKRIWAADKGEWRKVMTHELEVFYPTRRLLSFYIVPIVESDSSAVSALAVILRDVTEAVKRTETTVESEKLSALTLLAAGVAHEIGNPLNSLHIHLQLMEREINKLPLDRVKQLKKDLQIAQEGITRLDQIISQFLRAIRPSQPNLQRASINEILQETLTLMEREIADRDILVEREFNDGLPKTLVDRGQVKQAFYNVIKNALQAMQSGGILRVVTEYTDSHVIISFFDSGPGIPVDQLGRIFEPYFTTKSEGSGLGLMIVQRIVQDHGGTIELESNAGRGTAFRIKLPIHEKKTRLLEAAKSRDTDPPHSFKFESSKKSKSQHD